MKKIIILAGKGDLPYEVIKVLKLQKKLFKVIAFEKNKVSLKVSKLLYKEINFGGIITALKNLKKDGFESIIMVGAVQKPKISEIIPDMNSIKLLPEFAKKIIEGGDNNLLSFSIKKIKDLGFQILDIRKILPTYFYPKGIITKTAPDKKFLSDIKKGKKILNTISRFDIGQSIIIQNGDVVGIEGAEGTDALIKHSKSFLSKDKRGGVLVKLSKLKQELLVDLPTIGKTTIENCKKNNVCGVAYSSGKTIFLDAEKILNFCNKNKIFLIGV